MLVVTFAALYWPVLETGDEWSYHFPFAARIWRIDPGSYHFSALIENRWIGFPKLWEWLQGLIWRTTGSLRWTILPQIALTALYWWICATRLRLPIALLVLGFFMSPMLLIHYQIFYLDLPTAVCLAGGAIILLTTDWSRGPLIGLDAAGAILLLGIAGNIKIQGFIGVIAIAVSVMIAQMVAVGVSKSLGRLAVVVAIGVSLASVSYAFTYARTGNPIYPFELKVGSRLVFSGPERPLAETEAAPPRYEIRGVRHSVPQPIAFALSITELDWVLRGVAPRYNHDSNSGDSPTSGSPSRTGGWGQLFVLLNIAALLTQLFRLRCEEDPTQRQLVIATIALLLIIAFVPRSHELRYWLMLPLLMIPVNIRFLLNFLTPNALGLLMTIPLAYCFAAVGFSPNSYILSRPAFIGMSGYPDRPAAMQDAVRKTGRYCDDKNEQLFQFSQAVTGQPGFLSQNPSDCGPSPDAEVLTNRTFDN